MKKFSYLLIGGKGDFPLLRGKSLFVYSPD